MRRVCTIAAGLCLAAAALPAFGQARSEVRFAPGNYGTMVNGAIAGDEHVDYVLCAKAGQEMIVELTVDDSSGDGTVYFNILPPGSTGEAIYIGSRGGNSATVPLPSDGEYAIRLYQMGNDADAGKTSGLHVDISIQ